MSFAHIAYVVEMCVTKLCDITLKSHLFRAASVIFIHQYNNKSDSSYNTPYYVARHILYEDVVYA